MVFLPCLWLALVLAPRVGGQSLTGWLTEVPHAEFASVSSQFKMTGAQVNGSTYRGGTVYLFCADFPGNSIDQDISSYPYYSSSFSVGGLGSLEIWNRFGTTQNEALATSMAHWLIDNYYVSYFLSPPSDVSERQYAFQNALWEIFGDGATAYGLNYSTGNINRSKFSPTGSNSEPVLWSYMNQLINAVNGSGVTTLYTPVFHVDAVLDSRSTYQDYLAVPVPEPSGVCLLVSAAWLIVRRRR